MKAEIKAEELMIGNYILFAGLINQVSVISKERIQFETGGGNVFNLRDCFGIPITPEILEKCGWKWNEECNSFEGKDIRMNLKHISVNNSYTMFNYVIKATICNRIWYLHQLQNLYFALTGTHLTIEL